MPKTNEPKPDLTYQQGQQVAEILRRYVGEELRPQIEVLGGENAFLAPEDVERSCADIQNDIDYIETLVKLFPTARQLEEDDDAEMD